MLLESSIDRYNESARLMSPIYNPERSENTCFKFFYHMYGQSVGSLNVYLKPISEDIEKIVQTKKYLIWKETGSKKNLWHESLVNMEIMEEPFQIIFEGTSIGSHLGDIAIDDVSLIDTEECWNEKQQETTTEEDGGIFSTETCTNRCNELFIIPEFPDTRITSGPGNGGFIKKCYCFNGCERVELCCPDYPITCLFNDSSYSDTDLTDSTEGKFIYHTKIIYREKETENAIEKKPTTKVYGKIVYETNSKNDKNDENKTEVYGKIIYDETKSTTESIFKKIATEFIVKDGNVSEKKILDGKSKKTPKETSLLKTFLWIFFFIGVLAVITYGVYFKYYRKNYQQTNGYACQVRFVNENRYSDQLLIDNPAVAVADAAAAAVQENAV